MLLSMRLHAGRMRLHHSNEYCHNFQYQPRYGTLASIDLYRCREEAIEKNTLETVHLFKSIDGHTEGVCSAQVNAVIGSLLRPTPPLYDPRPHAEKLGAPDSERASTPRR